MSRLICQFFHIKKSIVLINIQVIFNYLLYIQKRALMEKQSQVDKLDQFVRKSDKIEKQQFLKNALNKYNSKWEILVLYGHQLGEHELKFYLSEPFLIPWNNIKHLNLSNNLLKYNSIKILLRMQLTSIRHLSLSENFICNEGFKNICYKARWPSIQTVDLKQNYISDIFELGNGNWSNLLFMNLDFNLIPSLNAISTLSRIKIKEPQKQLTQPLITINKYTSENIYSQTKDIFTNLHICGLRHKFN